MAVFVGGATADQFPGQGDDNQGDDIISGNAGDDVLKGGADAARQPTSAAKAAFLA